MRPNQPSQIIHLWTVDMLIQARGAGLLADLPTGDPAAAWFVGTPPGPVYVNQAGLRASGLDPRQR